VRHWDHWLHENEDMASTHLVAYAADGTARVDLTPDARRQLAIEPALDVSANGRTVIVTWQSVGDDRELDSAIRCFDIATRAARTLGAARNTNNETPLFSPDGKTIATVRSTRSAAKAVRPTLTLIDAASGAMREIGTSFDAWPLPCDWTADGKQIIFTTDLDGLVPVFSIDVATDRVTRLTLARSAGSHSDIRVLQDGRIAGIRSTFLEPPEAFAVVNAADSPPQTLARLSGFAFPDWAVVEHCSTPSTDGTPIQYFVTRPAKANGKLPTLLWIHGGPIGMSSDSWHWRWNPLLAVAAGYTVVQPNPRGSTGFGQDFVQGIWGNVWGKQCYEDLMAVTDAIEQRSDVDANRIMAMGGSFGGYMTNWIGTQTQRFKCLITHACVTTMAQFTGTTDHPAWWYLEMGGENPYAEPDRFDRYAPIRHVTQWKTPALIIHGELDYRCPISEGLNLFEALQYHGVPSELLIFPDENHWILKPRNIVAWYETILGFIGRHLQPA
jgi:dipeptidyl aminopeptidase/acylaminoacyl peptidase